MGPTQTSRVAIACQGGGSHTAFSAGVLQGLLGHLPEDVDVVAISGTSGGAMCAALAWDGLVRGDPQLAIQKLRTFWEEVAASEPWDKIINQTMLNLVSLRNHMVLPEVSPYHLPTWGEELFRNMLNQHFDFEELRKLARQHGAPGPAHRRGRGPHRSLRGVHGRGACRSSACWPRRRSRSSSGRSRFLAGACTGTGCSRRTRRSTISPIIISTSSG